MTRNSAARSAYPLDWPAHWPRTAKPGNSAFRTTCIAVDRYAKVEDNLQAVKEHHVLTIYDNRNRRKAK